MESTPAQDQETIETYVWRLLCNTLLEDELDCKISEAQSEEIVQAMEQ